MVSYRRVCFFLVESFRFLCLDELFFFGDFWGFVCVYVSEGINGLLIVDLVVFFRNCEWITFWCFWGRELSEFYGLISYS